MTLLQLYDQACYLMKTYKSSIPVVCFNGTDEVDVLTLGVSSDQVYIELDIPSDEEDE